MISGLSFFKIMSLFSNAGVDNKFVDALYRVITILHSKQNSMVSLKRLKDEYYQCSDIGIIYKKSLDNRSPTQGGEGYLFEGVKLCILRFT